MGVELLIFIWFVFDVEVNLLMVVVSLRIEYVVHCLLRLVVSLRVEYVVGCVTIVAVVAVSISFVLFIVIIGFV